MLYTNVTSKKKRKKPRRKRNPLNWSLVLSGAPIFPPFQEEPEKQVNNILFTGILGPSDLSQCLESSRVLISIPSLPAPPSLLTHKPLCPLLPTVFPLSNSFGSIRKETLRFPSWWHGLILYCWLSFFPILWNNKTRTGHTGCLEDTFLRVKPLLEVYRHSSF